MLHYWACGWSSQKTFGVTYKSIAIGFASRYCVSRGNSANTCPNLKTIKTDGWLMGNPIDWPVRILNMASDLAELFCQYWRATHMLAFQKSLRYVILTKFWEHIGDMSAVTVYNFGHLLRYFLIIWQWENHVYSLSCTLTTRRSSMTSCLITSRWRTNHILVTVRSSIWQPSILTIHQRDRY